MAIKTPHWAERMGAFPTEKGWAVHRPKGRTEIVRSASFSSIEIAEWHAASSHGVAEPAPVMQTLHEAPVVEREVTVDEAMWHHGETAHHHDPVDHEEVVPFDNEKEWH